MFILKVLFTFFVVAVTSFAFAKGSQNGLDPYYDQTGNPKKTATISQKAVTAPMKACSVYIYGNWRDTTPVPQSWTATDCYNYKVLVGASHYNLSCILNHSVSQGADDGGRPSPNCGW